MSLYDSYRNDPNNFSYWFPKIENCGIPVPKSVVIQVPEEVIPCFFMEHFRDDEETIAKWIKESVMPEIKDLGGLIFVKNGGFSNKFDFKTCAIRNDFYEMVASVIAINYQSLCFETGGETELVVRERIGWGNSYQKYHIYNGMPLRPEFRIFYDFDHHRVLYSVNYWDWEYCHDAISRDKSDRVSYEAAYLELEPEFHAHREEAENIVAEAMKNNTELHGIWSVDLLWDDEKFWLIDMAVGHQSAYYDPKKCGI